MGTGLAFFRNFDSLIQLLYPSMKIKSLLVIILANPINYSYCQIEYFDLNSKELKVNSVYRFPIWLNNYEDDADWLYSKHPTLVDSIVAFINSHSEYKFELGGYTTCRGADQYNIRMSESQASHLKYQLKKYGAIDSLMVTKGYGEGNPIQTVEAIQKIETEQQREEAHGENGRIKIKVLSKRN